jgi:AbrB family looped-hinge helix DNA binding protein
MMEAMAKVTGKFQITLPKTVVERHEIRVGDELDVTSNGGALQIVRRRVSANRRRQRDQRLSHFDRATKRQGARRSAPGATRSRGWTREELYGRGRAR